MADPEVTTIPTRPEPSRDLLAPQYVVLSLSAVASRPRRLEAEVHLSDGLLARRAILGSGLPSYSLGKLAKISQPDRLKGIPVDPLHGVPYLMATQVFDIWPTPRKWLAPEKTPKLDDLQVDPGCILVTRSGTVGNVIMTYSAHVDHVISDDLLRVEIEEPELRSYVYAFLRTRFGRAMMQGSHYGNVVKHIEVEHLEQISIPLLNQMRAELHENITDVFAARDEALQLDMTARQRFAGAMIDRPVVQRAEGYTVTAAQLFSGRRRLDAYPHGPSAQFVSQMYSRNAVEVEPLSNSAHAFVPGRFTRIFGQNGTPYLDSEPIFKTNPTLDKHLTPATRIDFGTYMVQRGWLLMACSGQIYGINGQAILANEWHEGKVITQHVMRIVPSDTIRSGYLQTVLSHPTLGKPLVVSRAYGTSVPELAPKDIEKLPIPRLRSDVEAGIADAAELANELRMRANTEENKAVSKLEAELDNVFDLQSNRRQRRLQQELRSNQESV